MNAPLTRPVEFDKLSSRTKKLYPSPRQLGLAANRITLAKYDGVCGIAVFRPGEPARMVSRTGEDYSISCRDILDKLSEGIENAGWGDAPVFIMGEVWRPGCPQPKISGDFRQQHSIVRDFEFRMFDVVFPDEPARHQPYYVRMDRYRELACTTSPRSGILWAERVELGGRSPEDAAREMGPGYDGVVVWDLTGLPLADKKATGGEAVKFKPNITVDVRCTGGVLGEGKHAGRLGALTYTWSKGTGTVGTGFSDKQREVLWRGLVMGEPHGPVNCIFEVEAMGLTPDGNLREPRFKGFRYDKKEAD